LRPRPARPGCGEFAEAREEPSLLGGFEVGGPVAEETGRANRLRKDDADRNEDGAATGSEWNSNFNERPFGIFPAAAESDAAFRKIFADRDFFLESAAANASEHAGFDAGAIAARNSTFVVVGARGLRVKGGEFGLRFGPDGRRVADFAYARDAFA
jgi:hypothetical protein